MVSVYKKIVISVVFVAVLGTGLAAYEAELKIGSFQLIGGAVFTSPSVATSGVITSIADVSVVTCCLKCTGISHCTGVFYDGTSAVCQPYHFDNYTSLNIEGKENFVHIVPECEKRGHVFNHQHRLCFDLFTTTLQWNQSREACQDIGGQLVTLDSVSKINFMSDYISYIYPDFKYWHTGASDAEMEGEWRWPNGSPALDIRTTTNETEQEVKDCSSLNRKTLKIQEVWCNVTRRRICEWPNLI
ncbi:C-type lectin domain family 4 member E-like isoform X2 [Ostrea edulis]|uniref:C-type lectin domain family 4 member E-like isoform X2 n=1 Tax=Ostrea edulis TaxID=37623 RepID=UPI0024AFDFF8|nr:C-type lectin domain family 4 member E-like isoform X2 [Ostrea edulis]